MKRRDLLAALKKSGCILVRHGSSHDWYKNPKTNRYQPVPRHTEIDEHLARSIIRYMSDK